MKSLIAFLIVMLLAPAWSEPAFDPTLARKVGADAYGMRGYVMAFLKKGPNRAQDKEKASQLQRAHLNNIQRLAREGQLCVAGPFTDDGDIRGVYIFNVNTVEEARQLTESDPLIQSGGLVMELHPWYGPAGLMLLPEIQPKISQQQI